MPELDDLNRSFNKMVEEPGSIETLRSDFLANFSHESKTPIVSIRGFAELLEDKNLPEEDREEIHRHHHSGIETAGRTCHQCAESTQDGKRHHPGG